MPEVTSSECAVCRMNIADPKNAHRIGDQVFCSKACADRYNAQRATDRPPKG